MRTVKPEVVHYSVPVREAHPFSQAIASALGRLYGRGINGHAGAVRYGYPAIGTRDRFGGYVFPPQLFIGWNPNRVASGTIRPTPGGLPGTQAPAGINSALLDLIRQTDKRV